MEEEGPSLLAEMMAAHEAALGVKHRPGGGATESFDATKKEEKKIFGSGLKKGFFSAQSTEEKAKRKGSTSIPTISAPVGAAGAAAAASTRGVVLPEVQSAVDDATSPVVKALQSGEWVTPGLQEKIANNPSLLRKFQDPRYAGFLQEMATDPKATMAKYKDQAEVQSFMMEMGQLLGDHFTELGGAKGGELQQLPVDKVEGPLVEEALRRHKEVPSRERLTTKEEEDEEQAKVNKILSDPSLRSLLVDPGMQRVLQDCAQPGGLARHMRDPETAKKIRRLAEAGLVQMQ